MGIGERLARARRFLTAMCHPRIASAMSAYGFDDADLSKGWIFLHAVGRLEREAQDAALDTSEDAVVDALSRATALGKAERALWAWYLHWSQVARVAVTQRLLLEEMGLGRSGPPPSTRREEPESGVAINAVLGLGSSLPPVPGG